MRIWCVLWYTSFTQKNIESVLRKYIREYVTCHTCKSPTTILAKHARLYFLQCEVCLFLGFVFVLCFTKLIFSMTVPRRVVADVQWRASSPVSKLLQQNVQLFGPRHSEVHALGRKVVLSIKSFLFRLGFVVFFFALEERFRFTFWYKTVIFTYKYA